MTIPELEHWIKDRGLVLKVYYTNKSWVAELTSATDIQVFGTGLSMASAVESAIDGFDGSIRGTL